MSLSLNINFFHHVSSLRKISNTVIQILVSLVKSIVDMINQILFFHFFKNRFLILSNDLLSVELILGILFTILFQLKQISLKLVSLLGILFKFTHELCSLFTSGAAYINFEHIEIILKQSDFLFTFFNLSLLRDKVFVFLNVHEVFLHPCYLF